MHCRGSNTDSHQNRHCRRILYHEQTSCAKNPELIDGQDYRVKMGSASPMLAKAPRHGVALKSWRSFWSPDQANGKGYLGVELQTARPAVGHTRIYTLLPMLAPLLALSRLIIRPAQLIASRSAKELKAMIRLCWCERKSPECMGLVPKPA
jgi:hypothetical protein